MAFSTYKNEQHGFTIEYPKDWEVHDEGLGLYAVTFLSPSENTSDYRGKIIINVIDLSEKPRTFEQSIEEETKTLKQWIKDINFHEQKPTHLGGKDAYEMVFSGTHFYNKLKFKWLDVFTVVGTNYYSISYSHSPEYWSKYVQVIREMLGTFRFS